LGTGGGQQRIHDMLSIAQQMWNPLCTDFPLPQVFGRVGNTLDGEIPTSAVHDMMRVFEHCTHMIHMYYVSVQVVGTPLYRLALMAFTHNSLYNICVAFSF
jgi:hypothetical protein